ncbi:hypothetical protein CY35_08G042900 [Sphagnum magellanicum]|nr:hypothetical protein CY35_08G042900 [Sphagnum magellanicum]KAH9554024.1 hypothetical protein CY35_08G042900 [Sphagnum magellanicum]KAH9554025.1 hypothetical protein CY35_08G042900 [Sphagnum magellanicum]KAH9554026.1 hypothetical protein CY35_08G042900 [Sphagnum magellanicum]KAH9554027.1 hypothetical protein CY35_08G042900 [Sphagnum magellanicum]
MENINRNEDAGVGDDDMAAVLPDDLQDLVLARIPLTTLFKVRAVCKRWNSILFHSPFLRLRAEIRSSLQQDSFFPLLFWRQEEEEEEEEDQGIVPPDMNVSRCYWSWMGYDFATEKWQTLKPFSTPSEVYRVVTGSKSLLCLCGVNCLLMCNPVTGACKEIPFKENVMHLVEDSETDTYKLIAAASTKRAWIYDSATNLWTRSGRPAPNLALSSEAGAFWNGHLYCIAWEERSGRFGVVILDVEGARTWSNISFIPKETGENFLEVHVVECGGDVYTIVAKVIDEISLRQNLISIWKLERESLEWALAGTMPEHLRIDYVSFGSLGSVAHDNRICIFDKVMFKAVVCDMCAGLARSWYPWLLNSHNVLNFPGQRTWAGIAFEPSLLTSV